MNGMNSELISCFAKLLSFGVKGDGVREAELLLSKYLTVGNAMSADVQELESLVGKDVAMLLKVACAVTSRRGTDSFKFGAVHTEEEVCDYFKALFVGIPIEMVYVMSFDEEGRALACDFITAGTVNSSEILPRKILEVALHAKASSVILAHNHPRGLASPSKEDVIETNTLYEILSAIGIKLRCHCVVAQNAVTMLRGGADFTIMK